VLNLLHLRVDGGVEGPECPLDHGRLDEKSRVDPAGQQVEKAINCKKVCDRCFSCILNKKKRCEGYTIFWWANCQTSRIGGAPRAGARRRRSSY
jgi:hypothetical protein